MFFGYINELNDFIRINPKKTRTKMCKKYCKRPENPLYLFIDPSYFKIYKNNKGKYEVYVTTQNDFFKGKSRPLSYVFLSFYEEEVLDSIHKTMKSAINAINKIIKNHNGSKEFKQRIC